MSYILTITTVPLLLVVKSIQNKVKSCLWGQIDCVFSVYTLSTTHWGGFSAEVVARLKEYTHLYGLWWTEAAQQVVKCLFIPFSKYEEYSIKIVTIFYRYSGESKES